MSRLLSVLVIFAALVAGCGTPLESRQPSAVAPPIAACDVKIMSLPPNADLPVEGAGAPVGAMVIAGPTDIDWSATKIGQDAMGARTLEMQLRPDAAARLADYTGDHVGEAMPLVVNGRVVAVPVINQGIPGGSLAIQGNGPDDAWLDPLEACLSG